MPIDRALIAKKLDFLSELLTKDYRDDLADLRNFGAEIVSFMDSEKFGFSR